VLGLGERSVERVQKHRSLGPGNELADYSRLRAFFLDSYPLSRFDPAHRCGLIGASSRSHICLESSWAQRHSVSIYSTGTVHSIFWLLHPHTLGQALGSLGARGQGLTNHSSRTRFAGRLNSGVRRHDKRSAASAKSNRVLSSIGRWPLLFGRMGRP